MLTLEWAGRQRIALHGPKGRLPRPNAWRSVKQRYKRRVEGGSRPRSETTVRGGGHSYCVVLVPTRLEKGGGVQRRRTPASTIKGLEGRVNEGA